MEDVKDLGAQGDVVRVADGYARNYLLPKGLAAPVTEGARRRLARLRTEREAEMSQKLASARELAARLVSVSVTIPVKTGGGDKLYGSVGETEIVNALKEQGIEIDRRAVQMEHHIKDLGVFDVKVSVHPEVEASVKVWVVEE
jgi:large subunit ribosomal protein L9